MKTAFRTTHLSRKLGLSALLLALASVAMPAQAAKFGVRVVDESGSPIAGASVCVGLQGNSKQFGSAFTDSQGHVMVDVPNVPLMLTVSKDRFTGTRTMEPARSFNLIKQVKLREGIPGPRCKAGSVLADSKPGIPGIIVSDIAIREGVYNTTLSPVVSGEPSQYRVSDNKDFTGAKWQNYSNQIALVGNLSDADKVYLQLRKRKGSSKAYLETRSEVLTVRIN